MAVRLVGVGRAEGPVLHQRQPPGGIVAVSDVQEWRARELGDQVGHPADIVVSPRHGPIRERTRGPDFIGPLAGFVQLILHPRQHNTVGGVDLLLGGQPSQPIVLEPAVAPDRRSVEVHLPVVIDSPQVTGGIKVNAGRSKGKSWSTGPEERLGQFEDGYARLPLTRDGHRCAFPFPRSSTGLRNAPSTN
jgi:hypothetical protein